SEPSRSVSSRIHENDFLSTNSCAAWRALNWSAVNDFLTTSAAWSSVCSFVRMVFVSASIAAALALASVVNRTTKISATMEMNRIRTVNVHGRTRLLKGFEARFRLVLTIRDSLTDTMLTPKQKHTRLTEAIANRPRRTPRAAKTYTLKVDASCRKVGQY